MDIKNINLTEKTLKVRCNHCGKISLIKKEKPFFCTNCMEEIDENICFFEGVNIQSEGYELYNLKASIINKDIEMMKKCLERLDILESNNDLYLYLKKKKQLKSITSKDTLDFIVKYLIVQDESLSKEEKIDKVSKLSDFEEYKKMIEDTSESKELENELFNASVNISYYDKKIDNSYKFGILLLSIGFLFFALMNIFGKMLINEDVVVPSLIIISIIPSFLLSFGVLKFIKLKEKAIKAVLFVLFLVLFFFILSYISALINKNDPSLNAFEYYIYHLTNAFMEIIEAINSKYGG